MSDPKSDPEYMKIGEAARFLGVNPRTVYRRVWAGELPAARIGGLYFIRKADLDAILSHNRAEPSDQADTGLMKCSVCYRLLPNETHIGAVCAVEGCEEIICTQCVRRGDQYCPDHAPSQEQLLLDALRRQKSGEIPVVVKNSIARLREINFLNRIQTRLTAMGSFLHPVSGEVINIGNWAEILEFGDDRAEIMHMLGKVVLDADTLAKNPLNAWFSARPPLPRGSKAPAIHIQVHVMSHLDEMIRNGFDTRPLTADDLAPRLVQLSEEARESKEMQMVVLASSTGWDATARTVINGQTGEKHVLPFSHGMVMIYLYDLESGELLYNNLDDRARLYAELFIPLLPSEEMEEVKTAIEKELVMYDSLTLENAVQTLGFSRSLVQKTFENLSSSNRFTLVDVPGFGLTISRK